jgi:gliding motility-associated-like protein
MRPIRIMLFIWLLLPAFLSTKGQTIYSGTPNPHHNYTTIFKPYKLEDSEVVRLNKGYESDPEIGMVYAETPCKNCFELIGKRTEKSKTFVRAKTGGKQVILQSSTAPLHYKDAQGRWRTIRHTLQLSSAGVYSASQKEIPVTIDALHGSVAMGKGDNQLAYNRDLELIVQSDNGTARSLGKANWTHYTAGDNGIYVTNAWDGIDMEIYLMHDALKTNFIITHPIAALAGATLTLRDHLNLAGGMTTNVTKDQPFAGAINITNKRGNVVYRIAPAVVYAKNDQARNYDALYYNISGSNDLNIQIPGSWFCKPDSIYPIIIDPLVVDSASVATTGSNYKASGPYTSGGCSVTDSTLVPPDVTISDVQFTYAYYANYPAIKKNGIMEFNTGKCFTGTFTCSVDTLAGECYGTDVSIFSALKSCLKPAQCAAYELPVTFQLFQDYGPTPACSDTFIYSFEPLTVLVFGNVLTEIFTKSAVSDTACVHNPVTLNTMGEYGTKPYKYLWTPGGDTVQSPTVYPDSTTTYHALITDQCGDTVSGNTTVFVTPASNPGFSFSPEPQCVGATVTVTGNGDSAAANYNWTAPGSANPTVAGEQSWTTTYAAPGAYDIVLNFKSGNCVIEDTEQVNIFAVLILTASNNSPACPGGDVLFTVDTPAPAASYSWTGPDGFTSSLKNPEIMNVQPVNGGTYTVTATLSPGCVTPPTTTELTFSKVIAGFNYTGIHYGCTHDTVWFNNTTSGANRFLWSFGDSTSSVLQSPEHFYATPSHATNDTVIMHAYNAGCEDSASAILTINPTPPIHLYNVTPSQSFAYGSSIQLNADGATFFLWTPDNGTLSDVNINDPIATPDTVTTYKVWGRTIDGCMDSSTVTLTPYYQPDYIPNAFTPNGDGLNDVFRIGNMKHDKLVDFRIYNRWGVQVFHTNNKETGWDGTYNGTPQDMGVYNYYIEIEGADGLLRQFKGDLTLIR